MFVHGVYSSFVLLFLMALLNPTLSCEKGRKLNVSDVLGVMRTIAFTGPSICS